MRPTSTKRIIAPLLLTLLFAILTIGCSVFGPTAQQISDQTAVAGIKASLDALNDERTATANTSNRNATATQAAQTARAMLATQKAEAKADASATGNAITTATAGPALAESNAPAGWKLRLYEPFLDNAQHWYIGADDTSQWVHDDWEMEDDQLVVRTTAKQGFSVFNYPGRMDNLATFYVTVDAMLVSGEPSSIYGLIFNVSPQNGAFYAFQIAEGGFWSVALRQKTYWAPVLTGNSTQIVKGVNHLGVKGAPGDFIFYVNNEQVAIVHDDRLTLPGKIGVIVELSFAGAESVTTFDNFTVLSP